MEGGFFLDECDSDQPCLELTGMDAALRPTEEPWWAGLHSGPETLMSITPLDYGMSLLILQNPTYFAVYSSL